MYWYLSFLRPPPVSVGETSESIIVTPQVANDLRTEVRYEPTEVYYLWQCVSDSSAKTNGGSETSRHLTTFVPPESTYRPLAIPLPQVRAGQKWRLGLFPDEQSAGQARLPFLLLDRDEVSVVGVWSEPISITAVASGSRDRELKKAKLDKPIKGKGKEKEKEKDDTPKQNRIHREWIFEDSPSERETILRIIEQTSYDLDKKIWDSGLALSSWLSRHLRSSSNGPTSDNATERAIWKILCSSQRSHIVELGSGTGLVSIALKASLRSVSERRHAEFSATDLESAMELMRENIAINDSGSSSARNADAVTMELAPSDSDVTLEARTLDWDQELPEWVTADHPHLIIAADVTYNTSSFPALVQTLCKLMKPSSGERPPLLLAYKQREEAERELWGLLRERGIKLELVNKISGAEEEGAVEIWVGQA